MSDLGRKDFSEKVQEKVTPQGEKSTLQQGKEQVTSAADKVAQNLQPDEAKSDTQKFGDAIQKGHDDAKAEQGKTLTEQAGEYVEVAKEQLNNAAEYVSNTLTGAKENATESTSTGKGTSV